MITKERLKQFISWYQSVGGCVSHHELTWFVKSVEEYLNLDATITAEEAALGEPVNDTFNTLNSILTCERCGKNPGREPHPCPYAEEIDDNHEKLCSCCDDCTNECAMDI